MIGKMRCVHRRSEMLLANCGQGGFECTGLSHEKHTEIDFAEWRAVYSCEQREDDPVGSERQAT
jgi:hypothetical protein